MPLYAVFLKKRPRGALRIDNGLTFRALIGENIPHNWTKRQVCETQQSGPLWFYSNDHPEPHRFSTSSGSSVYQSVHLTFCHEKGKNTHHDCTEDQVKTAQFFATHPVFPLREATTALAPTGGRSGTVERLKYHLRSGINHAYPVDTEWRLGMILRMSGTLRLCCSFSILSLMRRPAPAIWSYPVAL